MKRIEQYWERRNIGVDALGFYVDQNDKADNVISIIKKDLFFFDYILCKVPAGKMDIAYGLQRIGFVFAESQLDFKMRIDSYMTDSRIQKYVDESSYHIATITEREKIYDIIRTGVFNTDRISLDEHFGPNIAAKRYINWVKDVISNGTAKAYIVNIFGKDSGFFILEEKNDKCSNSMLASIYNTNGIGIGILPIYYAIVQAKTEGKKEIITSVSSNNPASVRLHLSLGYLLKEEYYYFVKHRNNENSH